MAGRSQRARSRAASMARRSASQFSLNFEKSWLKAVWITPSAFAAPRAQAVCVRQHRRDALRRRRRQATWRPHPNGQARAPRWPAPISSLTIAEPTKPVAPVTKTRMKNSPGLTCGGNIGGFSYPGKVVTLYGYKANRMSMLANSNDNRLGTYLKDRRAKTRSGGVRLSHGAPADCRTAARRSGAARQCQRDLVHLA